MDSRPVFIWCTSRSRSSLVANIFINHGLWYGDTPHGSFGYTCWEDRTIKGMIRHQKDRYRLTYCTEYPKGGHDLFLKKLLEYIPEGKRFVVKLSAEFFNLFEALNPVNVFVYRKPEEVAKSLVSKRPKLDFKEAIRAAQWRFDYMKKLEKRYGGKWIDTDCLIKGDFREVEAALEYCGISPEKDKIKSAFRV